MVGGPSSSNRLRLPVIRLYRCPVSTGGVESYRVPPTPEEMYDGAVAAVVPWLAGALALALVLATPVAALLLDGTARVVVTAAAAGGAVVLAVASAVTWRRPVPDHLAHPATAAIVLLAAGEAVGGLLGTESSAMTAAGVLVVAGAGAVLLAWQWLAATLYLVLGGWAVAAFFVGPAGDWPLYVGGFAGAVALAFAVNALRRNDVRAAAELRAAADSASVRDQLTGLANRRGLALVGAQMVESARRQGDAVHALFVDIEGLARVNAAHGHAVGDEVIVAVAEALRAATRATDVVARWGGDEFAMVGPGAGMAPLELERRVRESVVLAADPGAEAWSVRVSAGGAMLAPWDSGSLETLLGKADQEMCLRRSLRRATPMRPSERFPAPEAHQRTDPAG